MSKQFPFFYDQQNNVWFKIWLIEQDGIPMLCVTIADSPNMDIATCLDENMYFTSYLDAVKKFKEEVLGNKK